MATTTVVTVPESLVQRLTSRKFIATVFGGVVSLLVATGVIDASTEQTVTVGALPALYILVEGFLDYANRE